MILFDHRNTHLPFEGIMMSPVSPHAVMESEIDRLLKLGIHGSDGIRSSPQNAVPPASPSDQRHYN